MQKALRSGNRYSIAALYARLEVNIYDRQVQGLQLRVLMLKAKRTSGGDVRANSASVVSPFNQFDEAVAVPCF